VNGPERGTAIESLLRRDRLIVSAALLMIVVLAWIYMFDLARTAAGMDMAGMKMMHAATTADMDSWNVHQFFMTLIMWTVMMIAMMTPSAAPMVLMFASMQRQRPQPQSIVPAITIFVAGYFLVWTLFSAVATLTQWQLHNAALLSPAMEVTSRKLGGAVFIVAGLFQWTKLKQNCLRSCRSPVGFLLNDWRDGRAGAVTMGIRHGGYCLVCCFFLMALLFVAGVMNLFWVAAIAILVLLEKLTASGPLIARISGAAMIAWSGYAILAGAQ
jgi:predicted metal-binding membrane protein